MGDTPCWNCVTDKVIAYKSNRQKVKWEWGIPNQPHLDENTQISIEVFDSDNLNSDDLIGNQTWNLNDEVLFDEWKYLHPENFSHGGKYTDKRTKMKLDCQNMYGETDGELIF